MNKYEIKEDYVIGYTKNTNKPFLVDKEIYEIIKNYPWNENKDGYISTGYFTLHRFIIGIYHDLDKVEVIDHINRDRKDDRLSNLRLTTYRNNIRNQSIGNNNTTGIIGVCPKYKTKKGICYRSYIDVEGKKIELKNSYNINDCIIARLKAEKQYFGKFAPQRDLFEEYNI